MLLFRFSTIHFALQVYLYQQKEFGLDLSIQQAYILENMFCSSVLGCATDMTFKFAWLKEGFELENGAINSTYLTISWKLNSFNKKNEDWFILRFLAVLCAAQFDEWKDVCFYVSHTQHSNNQ